MSSTCSLCSKISVTSSVEIFTVSLNVRTSALLLRSRSKVSREGGVVSAVKFLIDNGDRRGLSVTRRSSTSATRSEVIERKVFTDEVAIVSIRLMLSSSSLVISTSITNPLGVVVFPPVKVYLVVMRPGDCSRVIAVKLMDEALITSENDSVRVRLSMSRSNASSCGLVASCV